MSDIVFGAQCVCKKMFVAESHDRAWADMEEHEKSCEAAQRILPSLPKNLPTRTRAYIDDGVSVQRLPGEIVTWPMEAPYFGLPGKIKKKSGSGKQ